MPKFTIFLDKKGEVWGTAVGEMDIARIVVESDTIEEAAAIAKEGYLAELEEG